MAPGRQPCAHGINHVTLRRPLQDVPRLLHRQLGVPLLYRAALPPVARCAAGPALAAGAVSKTHGRAHVCEAGCSVLSRWALIFVSHISLSPPLLLQCGSAGWCRRRSTRTSFIIITSHGRATRSSPSPLETGGGGAAEWQALLELWGRQRCAATNEAAWAAVSFMCSRRLWGPVLSLSSSSVIGLSAAC